VSRRPGNRRPQVRPRVVPTVPEQLPSIAVRRDERPARSSSEPGRCRQAPLSDGRLAANGGQPMQLLPCQPVVAPASWPETGSCRVGLPRGPRLPRPPCEPRPKSPRVSRVGRRRFFAFMTLDP
jgi:hypothetical protein